MCVISLEHGWVLVLTALWNHLAVARAEEAFRTPEWMSPPQVSWLLTRRMGSWCWDCKSIPGLVLQQTIRVELAGLHHKLHLVLLHA